MPGGLLNLVAYGSENIILNENPSKTFFKSVYKKYTNFGLQTFRMDYSGTNDLQECTKSTFKFKVQRYGDLLHDTYLSITLPDIYGAGPESDKHNRYNFKWIKHLGYNMIDEVSITIGGQLINKYSGEYLLMLQEQFQSEDKISHLNEMTGNTHDMNDPAKYIKKYYNYYPDNADFYPASYKGNNNEPSIKGKKLYIPINAWFGNNMKQALPLVSLQYHEVDIIVTLKAIKDLYVVQNKNYIKEETCQFCNKDGIILPVNQTIKEQFDLSLGNIKKTKDQIFNIKHENNNNDVISIYNYLAPEYNNNDITFDMFLKNNLNNWNPDIHLVSTFVFLTDEERTIFARDEQTYLVKICYEEEYLGLVGNQSASINVHTLVSDIFWRYRRSDYNTRNEWSNYTNIKYYEQFNYIPIFNDDAKKFLTQTIESNEETNESSILKTLSIMFDGKIREESFPENIFKSLQKYRTKNIFTRELKDLYYYSFGLEEGLEDLQPSGAVNTNKYKNVTFIFETINTPNNPNVNSDAFVKYIRNDTTAPFRVLTDNSESNNISINPNDTDGTCVPVFDKTFRQEKLYTFDLKICTRKYNVLIINSGMGGLKYAR